MAETEGLAWLWVRGHILVIKEGVLVMVAGRVNGRDDLAPAIFAAEEQLPDEHQWMRVIKCLRDLMHGWRSRGAGTELPLLCLARLHSRPLLPPPASSD